MQKQARINDGDEQDGDGSAWWKSDVQEPSDPLRTWFERGILSTVAHELRTPIAALTMSSELLAQGLHEIGAERAQEMLVGIHHRALCIQELVENLLCADTIGSGRLRLSLRPLRVADAVGDVHRIVEPLLSRRSQTLRSQIPSSIPTLVADNRRIGQVLVNLLSNASKFSEEGSSIDVRASIRGAHVRVTVADRGPGFPPSQSRRVFEPFHRVVPKSGTAPEGIGLGLAIVKTIVELHGGRVGARNRRGGGACFWLDLPTPTLTALPGRTRTEPMEGAEHEDTRDR